MSIASFWVRNQVHGLLLPSGTPGTPDEPHEHFMNPKELEVVWAHDISRGGGALPLGRTMNPENASSFVRVHDMFMGG